MNAFFDEHMPCSLVVFKNDTDRKIESHEQLVYARQAGLDFIMLKAAPGFGKMKFSLRSFQRCTVEVSTSGGEVVIRKEWDTDRSGTPRRGGQLWFDRDKMGIYKAPLLDSERNRETLARVYFAPNRQWVIMDPETDRTIRQQAIDNGYDKPSRAVDVKAVVRGQEDELLKLRLERDKFAAEKKALEDRLALALEDKPSEAPSKASGLAIDAEMMGLLKEEARRQIYVENAELVAELKSKKKVGWAFTPEYRAQITPLITERLERLKREYTEPAVNAGG